ncbi:MAG: hypothetical protein HKO66_10215 [Saprospiraceae bacterium]|nr:hypothetical protein [Bacteroidia bacterium]NNE15768.1 hypothetical protein [Saprospiraceae bacterium]NNL92596.1 hypothetical protein [Saprospiraceae bacterium]
MANEMAVKVVLETIDLLKDEANWEKNSEYDEDCSKQTDKLTLGCALVKSQMLIRGEVKDRAREMGIIRRVIHKHYFIAGGIHPITYFNSNRRTTHDDLMNVLNLSLEKLK